MNPETRNHLCDKLYDGPFNRGMEESIGGIYNTNANQVKEDMLKLEDSESNSVSNASRISAVAITDALAETKKKEISDCLNLNDDSQSENSQLDSKKR